MVDFKDTAERIQKQQQDKRLLRYLITDADLVNSSAVKDPLGCHYIYVKPGWYNSEMKLSNINFAQFVYAENGINLKKHISKLDGKETEVLLIGVSEEAQLPQSAKDFLEQTAPYYMSAQTRERDTELCNKISRIEKQNTIQTIKQSVDGNTGR